MIDRIKRLLYPQNFKKKHLRNEKYNKEFEFFLKKNSSMNNIYSFNTKNIEKIKKSTDNSNKTIDKFKNIDVNGKDTMQVLTKLKEQNGFITDRMEHKLKKVNSLIEMNLPYLSNYENIINCFNRKNKNIKKTENKSENIKNEKMTFSPISNKRKNKGNLRPTMSSKLISLKDDIQNISPNSELFKKLFFENKRMTVYNRLKNSLERKDIKIYKKKEIEFSKDNKTSKKRDKVFITEKK